MPEEELVHWMARSIDQPMKEEAEQSRSILLRKLIFSTVPEWKDAKKAFKGLFPDIKS